MEIVILLLFVVAVVAVIRVWIRDSAQSTNSSPVGQPSPLFANSTTSWIIDDAIQTIGDLGSSADSSQSADDSTATQDCTPDSVGDNSGGDCPCPADSTSYDSGGCSVDSGSLDSGSFDSGTCDTSFDSGSVELMSA